MQNGQFDGDGGVSACQAFRVLVVDDYEPFRRFVCSMLGTRAELQIVGEAADGLEAVHKAEELQPDLIVLDMGLPTLNGLEAAHRIRQVAPDARIIFLTQNSDRDVVRAALRAGAQGYVLKADAGSELFSAVEGVIGGDDFVSSGIKGGDSGETNNTQTPPRLK
jgi:DNA-binding NarL/FixJ family response regulator